jgi:hypothetical protein
MSDLTVQFGDFVVSAMKVFGGIFLLLMIILVLWVIVIYIIDVTQTQQTILRNYPIVDVS